MGQIWAKHIRNRLKELEKFLLEEYKKQYKPKEKNYTQYEKDFKKRFRKAMQNLSPLINKATANLRFYRGKAINLP